MPEPVNPELQVLAGQLESLVGEADAILAEIKSQHLEEFERIDTLKVEATKVRARLSDLLRQGRSSQVLLGTRWRVDAPNTTIFDVGDVVSKATPMGHIPALLEAGVLTYEGHPENLPRLDGMLRAQYEPLVRKVPATAKVHVPERLKG